MYSHVNIITYLAGPTFTIQCCLSSICFSYLGSKPYNNVDKFKKYWMLYASKGEDKKLLKCCQPFGFSIGPYGVCKAKLGLIMCDDIVHNAVTAILVNKL